MNTFYKITARSISYALIFSFVFGNSSTSALLNDTDFNITHTPRYICPPCPSLDCPSQDSWNVLVNFTWAVAGCCLGAFYTEISTAIKKNCRRDRRGNASTQPLESNNPQAVVQTQRSEDNRHSGAPEEPPVNDTPLFLRPAAAAGLTLEKKSTLTISQATKNFSSSSTSSGSPAESHTSQQQVTLSIQPTLPPASKIVSSSSSSSSLSASSLPGLVPENASSGATQPIPSLASAINRQLPPTAPVFEPDHPVESGPTSIPGLPVHAPEQKASLGAVESKNAVPENKKLQ